MKKIFLSSAVAIVAFIYFYLITQTLLWYMFDGKISDNIPTAIDYLQYWKEVYNFRECAAHTGYFGHEELLSTIIKWGIDCQGASHGMLNPIFYSFVSWGNWQYDTPVYSNLVLTALGIGLYYLLASPSMRQAGRAFLVLLSIYPIYLLNAYNSFQSVHILIACIVSGLVARIVETDRPKVRRRLWLALLASVVVGAFLRNNWALFLPALVVLPDVSSRRRWAIIICSLASAALLGFAFDATRSPYPYPEFTEDLRPYVMPALAKGDFSILWKQIGINLQILGAFVGKGDFDTIYGLFLLAAGTALCLGLPSTGRGRRLSLFGLSILGVSVVSAAALYYVFQVMLLKIVLQAFLVVALASVRYLDSRRLAFFLVVNILFLPSFLERFRKVGEEYLYAPEKRVAIETFRVQTVPYFQHISSDRWKNTVLIFGYTPQLLGLPPCVNVMDTWESFLRERDYRVRTGFALVMDPAIEKRLLEQNNLRLLTTTEVGRLYAVD